MFTACICSYTHSDSLQSEETSKIDLLLLYMPALWGSLIIITWPVVRSYHYSALEIRQLFCCSCGWAEKIIPSDYLGFLCLLLMLFNMGIIWKQLDLLYVITLLGLHEHEISLLYSIPALTLLFSYYWSVMCAINNIGARKKGIEALQFRKKEVLHVKTIISAINAAYGKTTVEDWWWYKLKGICTYSLIKM